jgi:hypothetical protein
VLRHETSDALYRWIGAAIAAGLVAVTKDQYRTLSLTQQGRDVLRGQITDPQVARPWPVPSVSALRRYRDDLPDLLREELALRRRTPRFGRWGDP